MDALRRRFREQRLRLDSASRFERWLVRTVLAVTALAGLLMLSEAVPLELPGGRIVMPRDFAAAATRMPTMVVVLVAIALAGAAAVIATAAMHQHWRARPVTLALLALAGITTAVVTATSFRVPEHVKWAALTTVGVTVVVFAAACLGLVRSAPLVAAVAAAPWLMYAAMLGYGLGLTAEWGLAFGLAVLPFSIGTALLALFGWQVVEALRGTLDVATARVERHAHKRRWLVPGFAAALALALAVGIRGALPAAVGGGSSAFTDAATDGGWAWLVAGLIAAAVVAGALFVERTPDSDQGFNAALIAVVIAWLAAGAVINVVGLAALTLRLAGVSSTNPWFTFTDWAAGQQLHAREIVVVGAGLVGGYLIWKRPRRRAAGYLLAVLFLWELPPLVNQLADGARVLRPELVTMTTAIAAALALTTSWLVAHRGPLSPTYALLLAVFGAVSLAQPIDAAMAFAMTPLGTATFYLGLVFPALFLFTFAARGLRPKPGKEPTRLLVIVGAAAATISFALLNASTGALRPGLDAPNAAEQRDVKLALVVPVAAALVAARAAHLRAKAAATEAAVSATAAAPATPVPAPEPAPTARSWRRRILAVGSAVAVVLTGMWALTDGHRSDDDRALVPRALSDAVSAEMAVNGIVQQRRNRWITNSDPANAAAEATHEATTVRAAATLFGTLARRTTGAERRTLATITAGLNREAGALDRTAAAAGLTLGLSAGCDRDWHTAQAELRAGRRGIARAFDEPLLTVTPADEATEQLRQLTLCAIAVRTALSAPIAPPVTVAQATAAIHTAADDLKRRADAAVTITPATSRLRQRVSSAAGHELRVLEIVRAMNAGALTLRAAAAQINTQFGAADADISAALADLHSQGA